MAASVKITGGNLWRKAFKKILGSSSMTVDVGIFEGSTYSGETAPAGTPVAMIGAIHEFGGSVDVPERQQTLYFKQNKDGSVKNKFTKAERSNFAQDVTVKAHTIDIPARSFLRATLAAKGKDWYKLLADSLRSNPDDFSKAFTIVGYEASKDIQAAIEVGIDPPLSPRTVAAKRKRGKKKADIPLIDTGTLQESIHYEVKV